jgi:hypothetical protein
MSLKKYSFLKTSCPELFRLNSQEDYIYSDIPQMPNNLFVSSIPGVGHLIVLLRKHSV